MFLDRSRACSILLIAFVVQAQAQSRSGSQPAAGAPTMAEVKRLIAADELAQARTALDAILAKHPASPDAHFVLGTLAERQNDLAAAASSYERVIALSPSRADAYRPARVRPGPARQDGRRAGRV